MESRPKRVCVYLTLEYILTIFLQPLGLITVTNGEDPD